MAAEDSVRTEDNTENTDASEEAAVADLFSVEILQIIKEAQQQHGLRHGDFQRYRGYCSRRLRRIRKSLHFPQGDKRRVNPKKIQIETIKDVRYVQLPLYCAERAWAYAMQLKAEANTEPRKKFYMMARLKKAVVYSDELHALCDTDRCDARTKLESQAYRHYMRGSLQFELDQWKDAIESYSKVKTIYEKLATAFTEDHAALYVQRVAEVEPNIRYCAYNIGDESAIKDLMQMRRQGGDFMSQELDTLLSQTREKQASSLSEVTWQGRTVPVKNETVRLFLLSLAETDAEVAQTDGLENKISIYESMLKQCIDAQQALRDTLSDDQMFKVAQRGQAVEGKISGAHYLHSYLTYIKLSKTMERNLLLIDNLKQYLPSATHTHTGGHKLTKPQDLVRLYDIIIQNLGEIPSLVGIEDGESLEEEMQTKILAFKAFRCYYIAQSYASAKKWKEAIGLYEQVLRYTQTALQGYKAIKQGNNQVMVVQLQELAKEADGLKYSCHASSILDTEIVTDQMADLTVRNNKLLSERLEQYSEDSSVSTKKAKLVSFPPDFKAIPCRPLFFDLALNHVEMPNLDDKMEQKKSAGGLTGMVKGWLWGGKK